MLDGRLVVLVLIVGAAACGASNVAAGDVIEAFDVARDGRPLLLPVEFEDHTCQFVLDTGSTVSFFDPTLEPHFKTTSATAALPEGRFYFWRSDGATIGRRRVPIEILAVPRDLSSARETFGENIRGVLGMDFLRPHIVQTDPDAGRVTFLTSTRGVAGTRIELDLDRFGRPTLALDVPGLGRTAFVIDTGFCRFESGSISQASFAKLERLGQLSVFPLQKQGFGMHGFREQLSGALGRCALADYAHTNQLFSEAETNVVGLSFLSRYKLTFDFLNATLIVEPGRRHQRFSPANRLGVDVELRPGTLVFREVDEAGLAWRLGIRPGDRVLEVDCTPIAEKRVPDLAHVVHVAPDGAQLLVRGPDESEPRLIVIPLIGDGGD